MKDCKKINFPKDYSTVFKKIYEDEMVSLRLNGYLSFYTLNDEILSSDNMYVLCKKTAKFYGIFKINTDCTFGIRHSRDQMVFQDKFYNGKIRIDLSFDDITKHQKLDKLYLDIECVVFNIILHAMLLDACDDQLKDKLKNLYLMVNPTTICNRNDPSLVQVADYKFSKKYAEYVIEEYCKLYEALYNEKILFYKKFIEKAILDAASQPVVAIRFPKNDSKYWSEAIKQLDPNDKIGVADVPTITAYQPNSDIVLRCTPNDNEYTCLLFLVLLGCDWDIESYSMEEYKNMEIGCFEHDIIDTNDIKCKITTDNSIDTQESFYDKLK